MDHMSKDLTDKQTNGMKDATPTPNRGSSVPDHVALGSECIQQSTWRSQQNIDPSKQIKIVKVSHMRYQHPDLGRITEFLKDFGMHVVKETETQRWFAGYGPDHYVYYAQQGEQKYLGGTFEVENMDELEKVTKIQGVECVSKGIQKMEDAPGGGYIATIRDPEGFLVNFICGQEPAQPSSSMPEKLIVNDESTKPRQRKFQRFEVGPAAVHKLGHFGLVVGDFPAQMSFYVKNFNIVPSDLLFIGNKSDKKYVAMFGHIDRGQDLVDHHTMFLAQLAPNSTLPHPHIHHSSFEVHDFDTQALGHQWLEKKGYESVWGVGRHILGSQIFDYWWDPHRFMIEHYADGDLVNNETPVGVMAAGDESLYVWGPEVPKTFLD